MTFEERMEKYPNLTIYCSLSIELLRLEILKYNYSWNTGTEDSSLIRYLHFHYHDKDLK